VAQWIDSIIIVAIIETVCIIETSIIIDDWTNDQPNKLLLKGLCDIYIIGQAFVTTMNQWYYDMTILIVKADINDQWKAGDISIGRSEHVILVEQRQWHVDQWILIVMTAEMTMTMIMKMRQTIFIIEIQYCIIAIKQW